MPDTSHATSGTFGVWKRAKVKEHERENPAEFPELKQWRSFRSGSARSDLRRRTCEEHTCKRSTKVKAAFRSSQESSSLFSASLSLRFVVEHLVGNERKRVNTSQKRRSSKAGLVWFLHAIWHNVQGVHWETCANQREERPLEHLQPRASTKSANLLTAKTPTFNLFSS